MTGMSDFLLHHSAKNVDFKLSFSYYSLLLWNGTGASWPREEIIWNGTGATWPSEEIMDGDLDLCDENQIFVVDLKNIRKIPQEIRANLSKILHQVPERSEAALRTSSS